MFAHEIRFVLPAGAAIEPILDEVYGLLAAWYRHGQTQGRRQHPVLRPGLISVQVLTLEADSLVAAHHSPYAEKQLAALLALTGQPPQLERLGATEPDYTGGCRCARSPYYVLFTHCLTIVSPLRCGGCDGAVPLYRLPPAVDTGALLDWQTSYQACDDLQLHVRAGEQWATRQLSDPDSELSRQGRELAGRVEAATGVPTYYYLFNYRARRAAQRWARACPLCQQPWQLPAPARELYAFCCEQDRLVSSISPNG